MEGGLVWSNADQQVGWVDTDCFEACGFNDIDLYMTR
jgi:hypothetical protein